MSGYSSFAYFYDRLTSNIDYAKRAEYFDSLVCRFGGKKGILLDLACGTGSLSEEFARLGYDVIGTDGSEDMLNCALDKKFDSGLPIQYLCQDMTELDMFGTIDVTVCALDSLNHLPSKEAVQTTFGKVSLFCDPEGLFIFDMNMPYKHKNVLADSTYVYDLDDVYCVWSNSFDKDSEDCRVDITLDIFERLEDGRYERFGDELSEIAFDMNVIDEMLKRSGFEILAHYDFDSFDEPHEESEKVVWVCRKGA